MAIESPNITRRADGLLLRGGDFVGRIAFRIDQIAEQAVDFGRLEAGKSDVQAYFFQQRR